MRSPHACLHELYEDTGDDGAYCANNACHKSWTRCLDDLRDRFEEAHAITEEQAATITRLTQEQDRLQKAVAIYEAGEKDCNDLCKHERATLTATIQRLRAALEKIAHPKGYATIPVQEGLLRSATEMVQIAQAALTDPSEAT